MVQLSMCRSKRVKFERILGEREIGRKREVYELCATLKQAL